MVRGVKLSNLLLQIVKQRAVEKCAHADIETVAQLFDRYDAGVRTPMPITQMEQEFPEAYKDFIDVCNKLESHYRDMQDMEFTVENRKLTGVKVQPIDWKPNPEGGRPLMVEAGEPEIIKAEAVFLAMGFLKPQQPEFAENVFVAGDAASGASLVVRAMASGRKIAAQVDKFLNK